MKYTDGSVNRASGTRAAFAAWSAALVAEGLPEPVSGSGDREPAEQIAIFVERYRTETYPGESGPFGDRRRWDGRWWFRVSPDGTVAEPGTSRHESRRSNDLGWPYNVVTDAHRRAQELAGAFGIECDGLGFGEAWHWSFRGDLGIVGGVGLVGANAFPASVPLPASEVDMPTFIRTASHGHYSVAPGVVISIGDPGFIDRLLYVASRYPAGPKPLVLDVSSDDLALWLFNLSGIPSDQIPPPNYQWVAAVAFAHQAVPVNNADNAYRQLDPTELDALADSVRLNQIPVD